jgi:hypothetical protein
LNKLPAIEKTVVEILAPEINRRIALMDEYGLDYPDKPVSTPHDYLSACKFDILCVERLSRVDVEPYL